MLMIVLRLKYKKEKNMKFISHLELIKTMERVFRRMHLPMDFSKGFSPKPKIAYAAPLPVGVSSECEYLDVELTEKIDIKDLIKTQKEFMPNGLSFLEGHYFDKTKSLMSLVTDSAYLVEFNTESKYSKSEIQEKIKVFLEQDSINYEKLNKKNKMKVIDIKPLIQSMDILGIADNKLMFKVLVTTGSNGNLKPEKLMELFNEFSDLSMIVGSERIKRLELYTRDMNHKLIDLFEV
jgi:radical SAM-linked protein